MPYIKSKIVYKLKDIDLAASLSYSSLAKFYDYDTHHLRNLQFDSDLDYTTYYGLKLSSKFKLKKRLFLLVEYENNRYSQTHGTTKKTDLKTNSSITYNGAGFSKEYESLNFHILFTF